MRKIRCRSAPLCRGSLSIRGERMRARLFHTVLVPIILVFTAPPVPATGAAVLDYIAANQVVYLVQLICFVGLSVPAMVVFLALSVSLAGANKSLAAIGGLIGIGSEIMALSLNGSPQSLHGALVHLSGQYIAAATAAQRLALTTARRASLLR